MLIIKSGQLPANPHRGNCPLERKLILMLNHISFITGINDSHLKFDQQKFSMDDNGTKVVHLVQTAIPMHCPQCGQLMKRHGFRPVRITTLPSTGQKMVLRIRKQKYLCKPSASCPQTITASAPINGIHKNCRIADLVKYHIVLDLADNQSLTTIAKQNLISANTVSRTLESVEEYFVPNRHWLPATIAFDDFKSGKFAVSVMSMLLMNPINHRPLDIIQSRNSRYLKNYWLCHYSLQARRAVRSVVVDLFEPYRHLIHELFPNAIIIADHFHVVVQAYQALQSIRIQAMNAYGTGTHEYRDLKRFWKLLVQNVSQLDFVHCYKRCNFGYAYLTNSEVVDRLLSFSDDLKVAYEYYQTLLAVVHNSDEAALKALLSQNRAMLPKKLQKVQNTLRRHQDEIVNSFRCHLTNGPIEGTNNKIKVIKRTAYGFRNFFHFRIRILLSLKNTNIMTKALTQKEKASPSSYAA